MSTLPCLASIYYVGIAYWGLYNWQAPFTKRIRVLNLTKKWIIYLVLSLLSWCRFISLHEISLTVIYANNYPYLPWLVSSYGLNTRFQCSHVKWNVTLISPGISHRLSEIWILLYWNMRYCYYLLILKSTHNSFANPTLC